jgi:iron(III) transport system ATP-binding protein
MTGLALENVRHAYGAKEVLHGISLGVDAGEIVCLLGPSGCGKTTLLRLAAGLETLQAGHISIGGDCVANPRRSQPPEKRGVGLMFQDYALFPHLTVVENVAFGLAAMDRAAADARAYEVLAQVGMEKFGGVYPHMLSGGEQQRVALARALAPRPRVMLLDEPFSGLDEMTRDLVREETLNVLKSANAATLMVTHNPEEAMYMADRLAVLGSAGKILQFGRPADVYASPADPFVAGVFGPVNRMTGTVKDGAIETPLGTVPARGYQDGTAVDVIVREDGLDLRPGGGEGTAVDVLSARPVGGATHVRFRVAAGDGDGREFQCRVPGVFASVSGRAVAVTIRADHAFVFAVEK